MFFSELPINKLLSGQEHILPLPLSSFLPTHHPSFHLPLLPTGWLLSAGGALTIIAIIAEVSDIVLHYQEWLLTLGTDRPLPFSERGEEEGGKGDRDPHQWSWLPLYTAIAVLAYLLTSTVEPVPEISFPFFLQHMLYAGEVRGSHGPCDPPGHL